MSHSFISCSLGCPNPADYATLKRRVQWAGAHVKGVTSMAIAEKSMNLHWFRIPPGNGRVSFHSTISCCAVTYLPYAVGINKKFSLQWPLKPLNATQNLFSNSHLHLICFYWNGKEEGGNAPVFIYLMISWWFCQICYQLVISFPVKENVFLLSVSLG